MLDLNELPPPPGVRLMTVGDARREFPSQDIGPALRPWGESPAVERDPDDWWCWVLGDEVRCRTPTREAALLESWRILWYRLDTFSSPETRRLMAEVQIKFLLEQGWGFPKH